MRALLQTWAERCDHRRLRWGGYVSLALRARAPEMTQALVICDSGPAMNAEARAQWNQRAQERATGWRRRAWSLTRPARDPAGRASLRRRASLTPRAGMLGRRLAGDRRACLDPVPTLVIVGDQDQPFVAPSEYMARKIARRAPWHVIPGAATPPTSISRKSSTVCCGSSWRVSEWRPNTHEEAHHGRTVSIA